ncbi:hypothetical protein, partial [Escherichia coli]
WSTSKTPSYTKSVSWQHHHHAGENITIHFDMTKCHFFDAETEIAIR